MQKKLNEDFIDSYCEKFASKITSSFFTEGKETITGKEILEITPSKQTNYFIIKLLFRYWQGETKKLESPFFNYTHEEVKEALIEFMNVLSQHIEVHKNNFQLLLNHALKDTLYLAASPAAYIEIDLDGRGVDKINDKVISGTLKYLRIYKREINNFLSDMRGLTIDDVIDELPEEFDEFDSNSGLKAETDLLSTVLSITPEQVLTDEDVPDFYDDLDDEVFDNDDPSDRVTLEEEPEPAAVDDQQVKWEAEAIEPAEDEAGESSEEISTIENSPEAVEMEEELGEDDTPEMSIVEEEEQVAEEEEVVEEEELEESPNTVNDKFEDTPTSVAEHHEQNNSSSIMNMISVNLQYMFVKELFKDDQVSFQNALYELEEYDTFDDAVEFLVQGYAKEFKWDMKSNEVKELLKVLFRKFRE